MPRTEQIAYSIQKQPKPIANDSEAIALQIIQDLENLPRYEAQDLASLIPEFKARMDHGIQEYGLPLQAHNGRDATVEAFQEAVDLCKYLKQEEIESGRETEYRAVLRLAFSILARLQKRDRVPF